MDAPPRPARATRAIKSLAFVPAPGRVRVKLVIAELEARLEVTPTYPDQWNQLGLLRASLGSLPEATACFERAIAIHPRFLGALENRAWAAIASGDVEGWHRFRASPDG